MIPKESANMLCDLRFYILRELITGPDSWLRVLLHKLGECALVPEYVLDPVPGLRQVRDLLAHRPPQLSVVGRFVGHLVQDYLNKKALVSPGDQLGGPIARPGPRWRRTSSCRRSWWDLAAPGSAGAP